MRVSSGMTGGRLEGVSLPDLLWELCKTRKTGVLELTRLDIKKSVYVSDGSIVFAASGDPNDRLGELLLREGLVTLDQLEAAISRLGHGKRLGGLLVEAGHLTPDNLVRAVVRQVRDIVLGLFGWEEGSYAFHEGPLPSEEVITLQMRTGEILLQGIAGIRSFARIRRSVGPPRTMYRLRQDPDTGQEIEAVTLSEGAVLLLGRLERGPERVEALCREMFLSNFEIYQTLWAFKVLGVIEEAEARVPAEGAALDGRLTAPDGLAGVLVGLCRARKTGVVHVVNGTRERAFHLKDGACLFATSNDIDDGLVAYLLRRGVISLRDREEVAKRVLSNKRVGTILLEIGVLDETDLRAMVREQLSEIVFDTIRWESGEYVFVPGELPTFEDITLDETIEDLVASGLRRVTAWSRVSAGCGAPDTVLELTPEYLGVLDRMRLGTDSWDVASALKQPRTVREVCRATQLSSFRACQTLWTLRLLGAVTFTRRKRRRNKTWRTPRWPRPPRPSRWPATRTRRRSRWRLRRRRPSCRSLQRPPAGSRTPRTRAACSPWPKATPLRRRRPSCRSPRRPRAGSRMPRRRTVCFPWLRATPAARCCTTCGASPPRGPPIAPCAPRSPTPGRKRPRRRFPRRLPSRSPSRSRSPRTSPWRSPTSPRSPGPRRSPR